MNLIFAVAVIIVWEALRYVFSRKTPECPNCKPLEVVEGDGWRRVGHHVQVGTERPLDPNFKPKWSPIVVGTEVISEPGAGITIAKIKLSPEAARMLDAGPGARIPKLKTEE